jgi:hypothetical protein
MMGIRAGTCRDCGEAVSSFARSCPHCGAPNQPNPVTTIIALVVLIMLSLTAVLGAKFLWRGAPAPAEPDPSTTTTREPGQEAFGWIAQAMADCDVAAKRSEDVLHFLIVPVQPSAAPVPGWRPGTIGNLGNVAVLMASADMLVGLRNGALELYPEPITFVVKDPDTSTIYKWKPATGVAELKSRQPSAKLTLGIQLTQDGEYQWGPTLEIVKGTCYWTNPLILPGKRGG